MTLTQFGATIAALVAGLLTMFGIIVTRGTKVSEFRQKWIDEQRNDLSTFLSNSIQLSEHPGINRNERLIALDIASNRIKLRENPTKPEWSNVICALDALRVRLTTPPHQSINITQDAQRIIMLSSLNLKTEWKRVKSGELGYRIFYTLAWVLFILSTIALIAVIVIRYHGYEVTLALPNR